MLILSRKEQEVIVIGDGGSNLITITVVEIDRGRVRIGITAPKNVPVNRLEVHNAIHGKQEHHAIHQEAGHIGKPDPCTDPQTLDL